MGKNKENHGNESIVNQLINLSANERLVLRRNLGLPLGEREKERFRQMRPDTQEKYREPAYAKFLEAKEQRRKNKGAEG